MDNLARCAFLAKQNGMSYGKYMALFNPQLPKQQKPKKLKDECLARKVCQRCGKEFFHQTRKLYCSQSCADKAFNAKVYAKRKERLMNNGKAENAGKE